MSLRKYLIIMVIGSLICWGACFLVIWKIDPYSSGFLGLTFFYLILFLTLLGTLSLIGFLGRYIFLRKSVLFHHVGVSLRQAILFSLLITFSLLLQSHRLFTWWNGILLILSLTLLEFFFLSREARAKEREGLANRQ